MGKKAAAAVPVEDVVRQKLLELATADGPRRLEKKAGAEHPPLFPSTAGAAKEVLARVKDPQRPLVAVVGTGKGESARLTAAGFARIADGLPEEKVGGAARVVAADLPPAGRVEFLNDIVRRTPAAAAELLPVLEEAAAAERAEAEARGRAAAKRREQEEATRRALARWLEVAERRRQDRIEALTAELLAEGGEVPTNPGPRPTGTAVPGRPADDLPPFPAPATEADGEFRRDVARRLATVWQQQLRLEKAEGARAMEVLLAGLPGVERVGAAGDEVVFDPLRHEARRDVSAGDAVRVTRPGWVLHEDQGPHLLLKAVVD